MSEHETQNYVSLAANAIISVPYFIYILNKFSNETFVGDEELKFWATAMLLIIPARIVAQILMFIIFMIIKAIATGTPDEPAENDERDKLIELKGDRIGTNIFAFGILAAMISVVLGGSMAGMFIILLVGGFLGEVISIFSKIYFYKYGV